MSERKMRVHYHTFGCKANQYDTERMRQEAEARGASTVERTDADVVVVNTCTVTNQADADARRLIRRIHREQPEAHIVVAGCSAALREADYRAMPGVTEVVRGHDPVQVATGVAATGMAATVEVATGTGATGMGAAVTGAPGTSAGAGRRTALTQIELRAGLDRIDSEPIGGELLRNRAGAARGWLKVQDGCDRKCSFCATRLARGASRSRQPDDVIAEARLLAREHAELVVTGIHIGHYGVDLERPLSLARLCSRLLDEVPDVRFRLGSVEATEVEDELLDLLSGSDGRLAPHLHMPLQSGADPVLRRMRRWHTREQYRVRALEIAARVPTLGLGADVITGFPGETADDHAATRALIEELPFTYLHVFPYSPRDGTAAVGLPDPVPQRVSGERARELRLLAQEKGRAHRAARSGGPAAVVVEGTGGTGLTEDYLRVRVGSGDGAGPSGPWVRGTLLGDPDDLYIDPPRISPGIRA